MDILTILFIIVAVLLSVSVLMQSRGTSVGIAFGGGTESFRSKKGLEKSFVLCDNYSLSAICSPFHS